MNIRRAQQSNGVRAPLSATPGGTITLNVGPNDSTVELIDPSNGGATTTHDVEPGKDTTIPIPNAAPGTLLTLKLGKGLNAKWLIVEIVSTGP